MLLLNSLICLIFAEIDKWSREPSSEIYSTGYGYVTAETDE
jgi:hypothetical protein